MLRKRSLTVVKLLVIAVSFVGSLTATASAQQALKGTFTLPYEVRWGRAVLPAGKYTITMETIAGAALVSPVTGTGGALVTARLVDSASKEQPTALLIGRSENEHIVRSFNWREGGAAFVYEPLKKAERRLNAKASEMEAVPILARN